MAGEALPQRFWAFAGGLLKIRLVEINDGVRRIGDGDGGGFQNLVVERDGQFLLAQTGTDEQSKFADNIAINNNIGTYWR